MLYGKLESALTTVDPNKNSTAASGNMKLEVTSKENSTTFSWTYSYNGIEAPDKCVVLRYENGFLKCFIDNWNLYRIGSTSVNLSEEEAIDTAMASAKTYSWIAPSSNNTSKASGNSTFVVTKFNVTNAMMIETIFAPSLYVDKAHSQDLFELFPLRHVWVSLDKFYPGNVYGMNVYLWADTKDVCYIHERVSTSDPPADLVAAIEDCTVVLSNGQAFTVDAKVNSVSDTWIAVPVFAAVTLCAGLLWLRWKKKHFRSNTLLKPRWFKVSGVLFCVLMLSMLLIPISTVDATPLQGRSTVWGSESMGAYNYTIKSSMRKTNPEVSQQQATAQYINNLFASNGYSASDFQGNKGSYKDDILYQISYNEQNYPRVAVVDFDHGVGASNYQLAPNEFHYFFEDNVGLDYYLDENNWTHAMELSDYYGTHMLYDMDIASQTTLTNTFFAFINACMSANTDHGNGPNSTSGNVQGMPYAWTHKMVGANTTTPLTGYMSGDGYNCSDNGAFCYIGFDWGSAALNQTIGIWNETTAVWPPYHLWLEKFFFYALTADYTVNEALDRASQDYFAGCTSFDETPLYGGFTAIWPMYRFNSDSGEYEWMTRFGYEIGEGWLRVYGNGDIKLYQPMLMLDARDNYGNLMSPVFSINSTDFKEIGKDPRLISGSYSVGVNATLYNCTFSHFRYNGTDYYTNPVNIEINSDQTIVAYYTAPPPPPPNPPTALSLDGPTSSLIMGYYYDFTAQAIDPDGDNIYYIFDWGDGTEHTTIGPNASGTQVTASHFWESTGQFNVKVRAQDTGGASSEWSMPHSVAIYEPPPPQIYYYLLTLEAEDSVGSPVTANVYIDGQLRGTTGQSFNVSSEYHSLEVSVPNGYAFHYSTYRSYTLYTNPCTTIFSQDTTVTVHYAWSDPKASTITSTSVTGAPFPTERKSFYANGRFWSFFVEPGEYYEYYYMAYKTSTDGITWSLSTHVTTCGSNTYFSIYFDGFYVHYVNTWNDWMNYRRGTPNANGTITWSNEYRVLSQGYSAPATICVDSNGYPFIGYNGYNPSYVPMVIKSSTNDGTWSTASGFPYTPTSWGSSAPWSVSIVPLATNKVYLLYNGVGIGLGRLWNGSSWGNEENLPVAYCDSIVSQNDVVHITYDAIIDYDEWGNPICALYHAKRTSSWGSPQIVQRSDVRAITSLCIESSTNNLCFFWAPRSGSGANHIYCKTCINGTWSSTMDWIRDSLQNSVIASFARSYENKTGVIWTTPYPNPELRFAYMNTSDTPTFHSLQVLAYDNVGGSVPANVYIDSQLVGTTGNSFNILPGDHTIQVTIPNGLVFQNYTYNGCTNSNNPAWIPVYSNMTVTANYAYSHYIVQIPAADDFGSAVTANVTIDGQPCGTTGGTFNMSLGVHTIQVSIPSGYSFRSYTYTNETFYDNPITLSIFSNMTLTANYLRINAPSVVDTTSDGYATVYPSQRKTFFANGRFWVFYSKSACLTYKTSTDGTNWSAETQIAQCGTGDHLAIHFDGTYVHYAYAWNGLFYRRGLPNANGTITWSSYNPRVVQFVGGTPTIAVDSDGYPFISYYTGASYSVIKSALNNGTWSTATGFPYSITSSTGVTLVPLSSGKIYVLYVSGTSLFGQLWNGSSWGNPETITNSISSAQFSVVTKGDVIHIVYRSATYLGDNELSEPLYRITIKYVNRTAIWSFPQDVYSWIKIYYYCSLEPTLTVDTSSGDLYCFWSSVPTENHIFYKKCVSGTWDALVTDWITDTLRYDFVVSSFYRTGGGRIGVIWLTEYPEQNIKFSYLTVP